MDRPMQIQTALRISARHDQAIRRELERRETYGQIQIGQWEEASFLLAKSQGLPTRVALKRMLGFSA